MPRTRRDIPRPPPWLRGKEIGHFYRDLKKKKFPETSYYINLNVPLPILLNVNKNMKNIEKIAKKLNIQIPPLKKIMFNDSKNPNEIDHDTYCYDDYEITCEKRIKLETKDVPNYNVSNDCSLSKIEEVTKTHDTLNSINKINDLIGEPSTSLDKNIAEDNNSKISIREAPVYKYGYEDIITGTFEEKLDECLSKGVPITFSNSETQFVSLKLYESYVEMTERGKYKKFMEFRHKLPAYKKAAEILETINNNQVVVISGETGCGKSTQVPQLLLDDSIMNKRGANVKILVTQPRRIAASSLAMRVAEERGENIGQSVGYAIRLEKVDCRPRGSIIFCTTGILLTELEVNQGLSEYSHVILDEVHERDTHIDLSMCMLKKILKKRKDLKLILMSATIDSENLSLYFDNCPMLNIEGLTYPVKDIYLEDILMMTKYQLPELKKKFQPGNHWQRRINKKNEMEAINRDIEYKEKMGLWLQSIKHKLHRDVYRTLQDYRIEDLNIELIFELLLYICKQKPGAILVFLPGISDITKLLRMMDESNFPSSAYEIYPLHSKLPSLEQNKIFQRPPNHIRKIIIATNIAETSITVDDVVYVVDCGRIKYNGLSVEENISTLKTEWISKANLTQRRGRAGRCQPGICYHLVTSHQAQLLEERLLPEMQRSDLLEAVLSIKKLRLGLALEAMKILPAVPAEKTIENAVKRLQQCGALDSKESLTPLGWHLARLPVPPCAGKLLILGALFGCLDRAASVAAAWGFKEPFQLVIGKEKEVDKCKLGFALNEPSDHVAISEAIIQWENCSNQRKRSFAYENFLSNNTLQLLSDMKNQFGDNLYQMGFLSSRDVRSQWENRNSSNLSLFKAIVAASLYPNIGTVRWNTRGRKALYPTFKVRTPEEDGGVSIHPSSILGKFHQGVYINPGANWLIYTLKQKSSAVFLFDVTFVHTLPLLFFGELNISKAEKPSDCLITIKTINVNCNRETTALFFRLRALLDQVLASKIAKSKNSAATQSEFETEVLETVIKLITAEDEGMDFLDDEDY